MACRSEIARTRGFRGLVARPAEAEASLAFSGLGDLLAEAVDSIGTLPAPQRRALRVALLLEDPEDARLDPRALSVAVLGFLRKLAEDLPVVVAVDDLQWLDAPTAGVLTFSLRRVAPDRVLSPGCRAS